MRISIVLTLISLITFQILLAGPVKGQDILTNKVTMGLHNESLASGLKKIEAQSPLRFYYRKTDINNLGVISMPVRTRTLEQTLQELLLHTSISFRLIENNILLELTATQDALTLKGRVIDNHQKPLEFATVSIHKIIDSGPATAGKPDSSKQIVQQQLTGQDGSFTFSAAEGTYQLTISYLGSTLYQSEPIRLTADEDLGILNVQPVDQHLQEVVIRSTKQPLLQTDGRKLIYNVESSITAQGTNVLEALKKAPGIIVSQDNSITLNGTNGTLVLINGRQTYLQAEELAQLLISMPSSGVKNIEIIKNPSAEYDAAGTGGIINIVLKKSAAEGFNGSVNAGVAYGKTLKQNTNLNLNYRKGKMNLFGSYNHNFGHYAMDYDNDRTTNGKIYLNANHDVDMQHRIGSTVGADYTIDTTKIIGIVFNGNFAAGGGLITPLTNIFDQPTGQLLQTLKSQSSYPIQMANRYNANLNYRYKGANSTTLTIDADFGYFDANTDNLSTNTFYSPAGEFQSSNNFLVSNSRDIKLFAVKADYGFNLAKGRVSTGVKFSDVNANNVFNQYDANGSVNILDVNLSNTFKYQEQITAGYLKYEAPISTNISFDLGLRLENTHSDGDLQPRGGSSQLPTSVLRDYLNLFPTAGINFKTEQSGTFNLSFARRIDRPAYNNLNPFSYPVDELSYWKGNPFLKPQYANSISLLYTYKNSTISAGYTHTSDLSSGVTELLDNDRIIMVPRNIGFQDNFNLTVTQQLSLTSWWNLSVTGIGYHLTNKVGTVEYGNYLPSRFSGTINAQQTFTLPGHITAEAAAIYNTGYIAGLNTRVKGNSQIDLGIQRNLLHDKATLKLAATDLFKANRFNTDSQLNNLLLHTTYVGESRQIRLNFSYRFGNSRVKSQENHESGLKNESQRL
ncbi:outer membrane beta-barrel protein [Pedobacter hartonius]|uniref:Outer membrane receptor proteins, mostly Fe transport n=1 Tax=Pedobacter hartonius TaxID=425514 RepID=A0A1H4BTI6_9SPHI|nr:outer membrane beta-barrel protein [Pedobacter hartonius]SEA51431.1 Outer membrane receptor proteins, mostly Fe transport [Pedobacter hartonius]